MWAKILRPDAILVWKNPKVVKRLRWYRSVMLDETPAKFLIVRSVSYTHLTLPTKRIV